MKKLLLIVLVSCGLIQAGGLQDVLEVAKCNYFKTLVEKCTGQKLDLRMNGSLILDAGAINIFFNGAISYENEKNDKPDTVTIRVEGSNQQSKICKYNDQNISEYFDEKTIKSVRYATFLEKLKIKSRILLGSRDNEMSTKPVDFIVPGICLAAAAGACYYFNRK